MVCRMIKIFTKTLLLNMRIILVKKWQLNKRKSELSNFTKGTTLFKGTTYIFYGFKYYNLPIIPSHEWE